MAVDGATNFASGVVAGRLGAEAVRVVVVGFSTTRIGWRSVGSEAKRAVVEGVSGPSAETDIRVGDSLPAVVDGVEMGAVPGVVVAGG